MIPLVRSNSVEDINTSLIATRREIENGGSGSGSSMNNGNMNVNVNVIYDIIDEVKSGSGLPVTSNAVAEYINDQNELSNFEDITLSTNSSSPTTMDYDGFIYVNAKSPASQSGTQLTLSVFINGVLESYYMASSAYNQNFGATACISVKKGDTVYYTLINVNKTSTRGRFFKKRDYSLR